MKKERVIGVTLLLASIAVIIAYIWLLFFPPIEGLDILLLKLTGLIAVMGVFGVVGLIGYTLATTPTPEPIQEIEEESKKGDK
ncbi:MAG: hypothetical protein QXO16_05550 [Archaeoglobaceae archaeon]